jgi:hypothetical protein
LARPQDASRRNAGKFFRALKFCGERVSVRTDWAAHDAPTKLVVSMANGILPGSIIGHRSFNAKEPLIVVGDDEEEGCGLLGHRNRAGRGKSP